ncbi:hypothetical protein PP635_gp57 [Arthrobacter phage Auxilium]|uniref:Uncharacterized protein n=1 Tax=Arthrobacter phage Auxilium TaxID=2419948 RepID=A0A3G2KA40_9CAUD|nr:hypothetical protein PP635_gp57 [Arthrobacter phage Auxilium]AYN55836.1 hypothetical protein PBI_AUXILIUM_57 [Arthrobacter phage Auxilium]UVF61023.1 hypothetical protein SEA_GORPY_61 [Arthrobacter phage Gorpy]UVK62007.1 hypothetical protein SEA_SAKAI_60 [Arthrobacter phage Sakai]WNM64552.1 hypothetical protein SEA_MIDNIGHTRAIN_65 [Arthrobacter phage MidnightRain]
MTALAELLAMVQGLDEDAHDFREVRAMKRLAHTVETQEASK